MFSRLLPGLRTRPPRPADASAPTSSTSPHDSDQLQRILAFTISSSLITTKFYYRRSLRQHRHLRHSSPKTPAILLRPLPFYMRHLILRPWAKVTLTPPLLFRTGARGGKVGVGFVPASRSPALARTSNSSLALRPHGTVCCVPHT